MYFDSTMYSSLQGSYLLHMQMKPRQPGQQGGNNQYGVDTQPPIMEEFIRQSENKRKLQQRRHMLDTEKGASMHEMLQRLQRGRHELSGLQQQYAVEQNPFKRKILESQLGYKTAGTTAIEHSLASSYDSGSSGFVGNENRIDSVGSFVTFG